MKMMSKILACSVAFGFLSVATFAQGDATGGSTTAPATPAATGTCWKKKQKVEGVTTPADCKAQGGHWKKAKAKKGK